jgi:hypothetical protein
MPVISFPIDAGQAKKIDFCMENELVSPIQGFTKRFMNNGAFLKVDSWKGIKKFIIAGCIVQFAFTSNIPAAEIQFLHGHIPAAARLLPSVSGVPDASRLNLAIALPLRNREALTNLLQQIYDPASPNYHHYLTPAEFAERFGPTEKDYQKVIAFANVNGLQVTATHPNRTLLDVSGPVANVQRALHVTMRVYRHPTENRTFFAPNAEPSLDLDVPVLHISGLDNYSLPRPRLVATRLVNGQNVSPNAGSGPNGTYRGNDFRAAYVPDSSLNGSGQVVGLLQFDGYTASDITYYENHAGLLNVPLQNVLIDGASGNPSHNGGEVEVSLDIEMAISMATNLAKVIVYEAPNPSPFVDLLNRMTTDNLAKQLSCSWFIPSGAADPAADQIFQQMATQGQSFFNASGDDDAYTGLIDFPGDTPYITQVGGTTLATSGPGGSWVSETVWNLGNGTGSGGGISTQYPIPSWQTNISMIGNQGSTTKRNTPDVALTANNIYVRADGADYSVVGTSCAAPLWAGFAALINQQAAASGVPAIGFINPAVDAIGSGLNYTSNFHDITTGNNERPGSPTKFSAVGGYDLCTGWGTPAGQSLINALANPEALQIKPATGFTSIGRVGGPFTITFQNFSLTNSGTNSLNWSLATTSLWLNASPGSGTLTPGGGATTVTASLNFAASNLVVGTYSATLWFTNLNDNVRQSRQFNLSVISPPTITTQPTNQAVLQGAPASFNVKVNGGLSLFYQWQDNGTNLTDSGNISGSTTTNLIINNVSPTNVGTYSIIVTNAAGMASSSNALLTITLSAPVINSQPTNQTTILGDSVTFNVSAIGSLPFLYQWRLNTTNVMGATNATLILNNVQLTNAGLYSVTISNLYGGVISSNALLTVSPYSALVVPVGLLNVEAAGSSADLAVAVREQDVYGASYFPTQAIIITGIRFRPDVNESVGYAFTNTISHVQFNLSSTLTAPDQLSSTFAANIGTNVTTVFDGALPLSSQYTGPAQGPKAFDMVVNFTTPFVYNPASGNLLVDIQDFSGEPISWVDAASDSGDLGSRVSALNPPATNGNPDTGCAVLEIIYTLDNQPPTITTQPTNQTVAVGNPASFTVGASGAPPFLYQWRLNTTILTGATNATLTLNNVQLTNAGLYSVTVSNLYGGVISSNAQLTVNLPPPCDPPPSGLISWWPAEGDAIDSIGGNNGAPTGGVSYVSGEVGKAFAFDGSSGYVAVPNSSNLKFTNAISVEGWINLNTITSPNTPTIVTKGQDADAPMDWDLVVNGGKLGAAVYTPGGWQGGSFTTTMATGVWYHVAMTYDGTNLLGYVNGVLDGSMAISGTLRTTIYGLRIGAYAPVNGVVDKCFFPGKIDELSLYNRALSPNEIATIYSVGNGGKCQTPAPPVITSQPTNQTVVVGNPASFTVGASGATPFLYQWRLNTTILTGATNATLTLNNVQLTNAGLYSVTVSNFYGGVISSNATLTVNLPPPCDPPPSGLIGWWPAEGNANDIIGTNNGSIIGGVSYTNGKVGLAFNLNGGNAYVQVPSSPSLKPTQSITVEAWINYRGEVSGQSSSIVAKGQDAEAPLDWAMNISPAGNLRNHIYSVSSGWNSLDCTTILNTNTWYHVAMVYDGTNLVGYINGVLDGSRTLSGALQTTDNPLRIGAYAPINGTTSKAYFNGLIDEASVYNRALSSNEIAAIYNVGNGGKCQTPAPPVITSQPTNQTVAVGTPASFTVGTSGATPFLYQWRWNTTNVMGATNATLILNNVQLTNAGLYSVTVSNLYGGVISSNATLTVNDVLDHFVWNQIPSSRFLSVPFTVTIQAQDVINAPFTNFIGTVNLTSTNGIAVNPHISANFIQGTWTGLLTITQATSNLTLRADDGLGHFGLANSISVVNLPGLGALPSGNFLLVFWPIAPTGFVLETSSSLSSTQWIQVLNPPLQIGDQYLQSMQMNQSNQFFRLRFPNP